MDGVTQPIAESVPPSLFFERLPEFLESLKESGIVLDPEQHIRLTGFLAQLATENRLPQDAIGLSRMITPLLAGTPAQQAACEELFRSWFGDSSARRSRFTPDADLAGNDKGEAKRRSWWRHPLTTRITVAFTIAMAIVTVLIVFLLPPQSEREKPTPRETNPVTVLDLQAALHEWLQNYPIQELNPPEQSPTNRTWRWYYTEYGATKAIAAFLPWALFLAGLGWLIYRMVLHLRREALRKNLRLLHWRIDKPPGRFGSRSLLSELQPLRFLARDTIQVLDPQKTILETAQSGGLLQPRFSDHPITCDFVALIEQRSAHDHLAEHNRKVVSVLQDAGLFVEVFEFNRDPTLCRSARTGEHARLQEILGRFGDSVVLVFIEAERLVDPATGRLMRWVTLFKDVPRCALLTPWGAAQSSAVVEASRGTVRMPNIAISPQGLVELVQRLTNLGRSSDPKAPREIPEGTRALIDFLDERPGRWLQPVKPRRKDVKRLLALLRDALGSKGYQWIAASAFYPELRWSLTVALKSALKDGKGGFAYDRDLLTTAQLPWFRHGWMPEWLRSALQHALDAAQARDVRRVLLGAIGLSPRSAKSEESLEIDLGKKAAPAENPLRVDRILLEFILPALQAFQRLFTIPASWAAEIARGPLRHLTLVAALGALGALAAMFAILSFLPIEECDLYAASPYDNLRVGPPVNASLTARFLTEKAGTACKNAMERHPENPRFLYQYARALARKDPDLSFKSALQAASAGYPAAFDWIGDGYYYGRGTAPDFAKAEEAYRQAVALGNKASYASLADLYSNANFERKDEREAFRFAQLASDEGGTSAWRLALYYEKGEIVGAPDIAKYLELLRLGVSRREAFSAILLAHEYYRGLYVPTDRRRSHELTEMALRWSADPLAAYNLAIDYLDGVVGPPDLEKATYWFIFAAKLGDTDALVRLSEMIFEGKARFSEGYDLPGNVDRLMFVRIAANGGSAEAQYFLASKLEELAGDDEAKKQEAIDWYRKAAAQNHQTAKDALKRLGVN